MIKCIRIGRQAWRNHINGMDDNWLAKIRNGEPNIWMASKMLVRKLNINVEEQDKIQNTILQEEEEEES